jgi:hypothetical protein
VFLVVHVDHIFTPIILASSSLDLNNVPFLDIVVCIRGTSAWKCLPVGCISLVMLHSTKRFFLFSELNPNAGARLRSDVALLHPTLYRHDCGDITIYDHITDNPLDTNNVLEVTREILRENGEQIGPILPEQDTGPILPGPILPEQDTSPILP